MNAFAPYPAYLETVHQTLTFGPTPEAQLLVGAALDGQASRELRRLVPIQALREMGAFFTGSVLSRRAASLINRSTSASSSILDPACGAGDLLLAYTRHIPAETTWRQTIESWNDAIFGLDLQPDFVRAAQLRLSLAAWQSTYERTGLDPGPSPAMKSIFPGVRVGSGLDASKDLDGMKQILLNPPFTHSIASKGCKWARGRTSTAALFLANCLERSNDGAALVAILPDVLRSGSRYKRFRRYVESLATIRDVRIAGRFDSRTDVDVFLLSLEVRKNPGAIEQVDSTAWQNATKAGSTIGDHFKISVGPVVDFRDPHSGASHPFARPKDLPPWQSIYSLPSRRRYSGRLVKTPFVTIRRTSSPSDKWRATANVISRSLPVAVENHLLVAEPYDGTLRSCKALVRMLRTQAVNDWLNERIRCRHLTVEIIRLLPWGEPS